MATKYGEAENIFPLLAPVDIGATQNEGLFVDMKTAHSVSFLVYFGALTTTTAADEWLLTVCANTTAVTTTETAVTFKYRKSSATGTNTWGAITQATATGIAVASTDDGKAFLITVDPALVQTELASARYVHVNLTVNGDMTATLVSNIAFIEPRYQQTTMASAAS
jgi:hypothetical protein